MSPQELDLRPHSDSPTAAMLGASFKLGRTALSAVLNDTRAPQPIRPGARPRRYRSDEVLDWLRGMQTRHLSSEISSYGLLTRKEIGALLGLKRTATQTILGRPGAPAPVRFNSRTLRWFAQEIHEWDHRDTTTQITFPAAVTAPAPVARVGRPRKRIL